MNDKGLLLVLSGPSGCGKGTVCDALIKGKKDIVLSISATTRDKRAGEKDGVNYFYKTKEEFEEMIRKDLFFEYALGYSGNYYGTPKGYVLDKLNEGVNVLLEIEMQGAMNVKKAYPDAVLIFLVPPSMEELYRRLVSRGRETDEQIKERFSEAINEMKLKDQYDYTVVNDTVEAAVKRICEIIDAEKMKNEK